jgi:hypothetical protein
MAGALTISTLNDSSGVLATQNGMSGIAKAWVNFNGLSGASPVTRASFNVSSVTRNGTGNYTVAFTTSMPDTNYCVTVGAFISTTTTNTGRTGGAYSYSTGSFIMQTGYVGVQDDMQFMNVAVFR